jgi:hypothetical protein
MSFGMGLNKNRAARPQTRLGGVNGEINMALLGHTDPSVHDKYGAKDKAIRFQHRLAEAVASVSYVGLDLSRVAYRRTS